MRVSTYLHIIDGRLRVKVRAIKGSTNRSAALEQTLGKLPGIRSVDANPVTANVLVLFDESMIDAASILRCMKETGYLAALPSLEPCRTAPGKVLETPLSNAFAQSLFEAAVEVAVQSAVRHVIAALI